MINILLVDDNEVNRFVAVKLAERWGINMATANNGIEAIEMIVSQSFDMVLMDLHMPIMDGYESTQVIREKSGAYFKIVPIIACTASEMNEEREKAFAAGMTDFISKPLQQQELQDVIDKYVSVQIAEQSGRPLTIDFDQYTDGDAEFKKELTSLIIEDIGELRESLEKATQLNDPIIFTNGYHKSKSTIIIINDPELDNLLCELEKQMTQDKVNRSTLFSEQVTNFNRIIDDLLIQLLRLN